jgi:XRE family aerobic/anaerobic benzoate catabolism transcriptional regulator
MNRPDPHPDSAVAADTKPRPRIPARLADAAEPTLADAEFQRAVGAHVRELRERRGMTRKRLALEADVSERYLGQLEAGEGNGSMLLLRRLAAALHVSLAEIVAPDTDDGVERRLVRRLLERVPAHRLEDMIFRLMREFGQDDAARRKRVALIGLRGAGKSTQGALLAAALEVPFIELDGAVEHEAGMPLNEIFSLYGQSGYRRIERRCLERVIAQKERAVISVGGGIVAEDETFRILLANCYTVWLKASPEEHMARVIAQGDLRPMAGSAEAMEDLKRILGAREPLYRKADAVVETSGLAPEAIQVRLRELVVS